MLTMFYVYDEHKVDKTKRIVCEFISEDKAREFADKDNKAHKERNAPYVCKVTQDKNIFR